MKIKPTSSSLLISLSTYPDFQTDNYLNSIVSNLKLVKEKRQRLFKIEDDRYSCYFNSLLYTMWGFWDVCVLTLSDNAEIITKVIQPDLYNSYQPEGQNSSKLYSGISFKNIGTDPCEISKIAKDTTSFPIIGIVNLKFASKWLLPNGDTLPYYFFEYVKRELSGFVFFPIHTFNTYEVTIVILGDDLHKISEKIFQIREMKVSDIVSDGTLIKKLPNKLTESESHLFVDSQSYFGARLIHNSNEQKDEISEWGLSDKVTFEGVKAVFEIEAKPGHAKDLELELDKAVRLNFERIMQFQAGSYDYYINWNYDHHAFKFLFDALRAPDSKLKKHIKKLKTRLLFKYTPNDELFPKHELRSIGKYFDLSAIDASLKTIKVSKSMRHQIVKLFSTFQNSIRENVTYNAFIDLFFFVKNLESIIDSYKKQTRGFLTLNSPNGNRYTVNYIENQLDFIVTTFKDSYYLRYVNDRIIDVQDFLIPHNTQLQTLIGFYDSYAKCILSSLMDSDFGNSMILSFDDHFTNVNHISIKLLSSNLFEPGLIFTALSKELVTICSVNRMREDIDLTFKSIHNLINAFFIERPDNKLIRYKELFLDFDFYYGVTDYLRYKYFFKKDFDLFLFYHIGFILQYPKVYDSTGNINKHQLFIEIQRLELLNYLIIEVDGQDYHQKIKDMYISPEIRSLWDDFLIITNNFFIEYETQAIIGNSIVKVLGKLIGDNEDVVNFNSLENPINAEEEFACKYVKTSYKYMERVYNKGKFAQGLSRNWITGEVNIEFIKKKKDYLKPYFLFDSLGGVFFPNFNNLMEFSQFRNEVFEELRQMSHLYKGSLYEKILHQNILT